jgi:hypothetical protein
MKKRIDEVKDFIKENCLIDDEIQTFFTRNLCGDPMSEVYNKDGVKIDVCYAYEYIEVFGLEDEEQEELMNSDFCY